MIGQASSGPPMSNRCRNEYLEPFGQGAFCLLAITGLAGCFESNAEGLSIKYEDITPVNTAGAYGADENTSPEICGFIPYVTNNLSTATETLLLTYVLDSGEIGKISGCISRSELAKLT